MFAFVICLSGEWRFWSSERPQLSQLPDAEGAVPAAGAVPEGVSISVAAIAATRTATTNGLCMLSFTYRNAGVESV